MNLTSLKFAALATVMALAVTGATITAVTPAFGADLVVTGTPPTARVGFADLNLRSEAGVAALKQRVHAAADRLCLSIGVEPLQTRMQTLTCRDGAIASAAPQVRQAIARAAASQPAGNEAVTLTLLR